jgi:hypothetical protein
MSQDDHIDEGEEVPPPPPPKPSNLKSQAARNSSPSPISLCMVFAVGLAALFVSAVTFVVSNDPTTPTLLDSLSNLHFQYVSAPSIDIIADLVSVKVSGDALSSDQAGRLASFRDRWNAAQVKPDWTNVTHASVSLPRQPYRYYRSMGMSSQEHEDAKREFEEGLSSGELFCCTFTCFTCIHTARELSEWCMFHNAM